MEKFVLIWFAALSLLAFFAYFRDKRRARAGKWRTPEATLLLLGFLGGAVGALISMSLFHHKTRHVYFWVVNILGVIWQGAAIWFLMRGWVL